MARANREPLKPTEETGTGTITVAQVGIERTSENDNPLNGMCYVIKLSNGNVYIVEEPMETVLNMIIMYEQKLK